jgi:chemotaxis protein histidine kinase CheA
MSDLSDISIALNADTKPFVDGLKNAASQMGDFIGQAEKMGEAVAAALGPVGEAIEAVGQAMSLGAGAFAELGKAAIDAANLMDPKGAKEYADAQNHLQDTLLTVAGTLGKELRPIVEAVTNKLQEMAAWALKIDFHKLFQDLAAFGSSVVDGATKAWEALKGFSDQVEPWADMLGKIMFLPADIMRNGFAVAIGGILDTIAKVAEAGERLGVLAPGWGDAFKDASATVKAMGGSFYDDLKAGTAIAIKGAKDLAAAAQERYASGPPTAIARVSAGSRKEDAAGAAAAAAIQKQVDAAQLANGQAIAGMHAQDAASQIAAANQAAQAQVDGAKLAASEAHAGFEAAKAVLEEAYKSGNVDQVAAAQQAAAVALKGEQEKGKLAVEAAQKAADLAAFESANADEAMLDARAKMVELQKAADDSHNADAYKAATAATKEYEAAQKTAATAAERDAKTHRDAAAEAEKIRVQGAKDAAAITKEAAAWAKAQQVARIAGSALASNLSGSSGNVAKAVETGLDGGDPLKAAIGAGVAIIAKSQGFTDLMNALNTLLDSVGSALGQLFEGLAPLVGVITQALAPSLKAVGEVLRTVTATAGQVLMPLLAGLAPFWEAIAQLLSAFAPLIAVAIQLAVAASGLGPALVVLGALFKILAPLVGYLAAGVKLIVDGIAGAWNWVISEVQSLLNELAKLPYVGDVFKDMSTSLDSFKVKTDYATQSLQDLGDAAQKARNQTDDAWAKAAGLQKASDEANAYAQAHPGDATAQAAAKALTKAAQDAYNNIGSVNDAQVVAAAQQALTNFYNGNQTGNLSDLQTNLSNAYAQQAYDEAQTTAAQQTAENTKKIAESISNLPDLYNLAAARSGFIAGDGTLPGLGTSSGSVNSSSGSSGSGGSGATFTGDIHVTANNPAEFIKAMEAHAARSNYRVNGTLGKRPGSRNSTQP